MGKDRASYRREVVAANLKRLIGKGGIISVNDFVAKHGSDIRTVKRWRKEGVDSLSTITEIAATLGLTFLHLVLTEDEMKSFTDRQ